MLETPTSNGKLWEQRLNGADVMTKNNVYTMIQKIRMDSNCLFRRNLGSGSRFFLK